MTTIERVEALIREKKISGNELARVLNLKSGNFSVIMSGTGRKFSAEHIKIMAKYFNVTTDYLYGLSDTSGSFIPLIGKAHCGDSQEYDLENYELISIDRKDYKEGMYAVRAEGDSMMPNIHDNDILYCLSETITKIENNDIVHYNLNGSSGIRKYKINEKGTIITLVPLNSNYEITTIHYDDRYELKMAKVCGLKRETNI